MNTLNKITPNFVKESWIKYYYYNIVFFGDLIANYYYDFQRFFKYSATTNPYQTKDRHQGRITAHYHQIEKGLALKNTKVGFGKNVVWHLITMLESYQKQYGMDELSQIALNTLFSYYQFNLENGLKDLNLYERLLQLSKAIPNQEQSTKAGGVIEVSRENLQQAAQINFREFVNTRHSIRNFDPNNNISLNLIQDAVSMALKTPSVCNRQTWKVYVFSDENSKRNILSHQNGNRGFGNTASKILIVTSDLNYFMSASERNQCFIDGGMFAMSLIYGLHSLGVGTCCLNWSADYQRDLALKSEAKISNCESIIMMIAVGHMPELFAVASSPRKNLEKVLFVK